MGNKKKKKKKIHIILDHSAHFSFKEYKLVELHRLRPVKDFHVNGWINPERYEVLKKKLEEEIASNDGVYPKSQAIAVWKAKDPEDRRRIIYKIEDGYRRYLVAKDLGLEMVYVKIIDEANIE